MNKKRICSGAILAIIVFAELFITSRSVGFFAPLFPAETYAAKAFCVAIVWLLIAGATIFGGLHIVFNESRWKHVITIGFVLIVSIGLVCLYVDHRATFAYFYHMGSTYEPTTDTDDFIGSIREALALDKDNYRYWRAAGDAYYRIENYDFAIHYYNNAIERNNDDAKLHFLAGRAYSPRRKMDDNNNDFESARDCFQIAVDQRPNSAEYNYGLAIAWCDLGDYYNDNNSYENAIKFFDAAISNSSRNAVYYYKRGRCNFALNNTNEAVTDFSEAIRYAPDAATYYYWRGRAYVNQGDLSAAENAVNDFDKAISKITNDANYYYWRGRAYYIIGDDDNLENAKNDFDTAIRLNGERAVFYYYGALTNKIIGNSLKKQGDIETAEMHFQTEKEYIDDALRYDPNNSLYIHYIGSLKYNLHEYDLAVNYFKSAAELSNNASYYFDLGDAYYMQGLYGEAVDAYSTAINNDPSSVLYLSRRQFCYLLLENYALAKKDAERIMELDDRGKEISY